MNTVLNADQRGTERGTEEGTERGTAKGTPSQVISVCNYSTYQVVDPAKGHSVGHRTGHSLGHKEGQHLKKIRIEEDKKDKRETPPQTQNLDAARDGEESLGEGVFVNYRTVRHRSFTVSLESVVMQLCTHGMPKDKAEELARASAIALQWATGINGGKPSGMVVPSSQLHPRVDPAMFNPTDLKLVMGSAHHRARR